MKHRQPIAAAARRRPTVRARFSGGVLTAEAAAGERPLPLRLVVHACQYPKDRAFEADYEDAWDGSTGAQRFAVADGASESSFARTWAELLVREFVRAAPGLSDPSEFAAWLPHLQESWKASVPFETLPWYAREKALSGAFAAFVGTEIRASAEHAGEVIWRAVAVGDSCIFHVRGGRLLAAFPLTRSEEFGRSPELLCSVPEADSRVMSRIRFAEGQLLAGDRLFLMTDAIAEFTLLELEAGRVPWAMITHGAPSAFGRMVERLRVRGRIRKDDTTVVCIGVRRSWSEWT